MVAVYPAPLLMHYTTSSIKITKTPKRVKKLLMSYQLALTNLTRSCKSLSSQSLTKKINNQLTPSKSRIAQLARTRNVSPRLKTRKIVKLRKKVKLLIAKLDQAV
jgi:hypothetical protein